MEWRAQWLRLLGSSDAHNLIHSSNVLFLNLSGYEMLKSLKEKECALQNGLDLVKSELYDSYDNQRYAYITPEVGRLILLPSFW